MCPAITDDFSYQPITGDVSFHVTKMFYHSSCFLLLPWLPRRHWAAQPMKLCLVIYKRSLLKTHRDSFSTTLRFSLHVSGCPSVCLSTHVSLSMSLFLLSLSRSFSFLFFSLSLSFFLHVFRFVLLSLSLSLSL